MIAINMWLLTGLTSMLCLVLFSFMFGGGKGRGRGQGGLLGEILYGSGGGGGYGGDGGNPPLDPRDPGPSPEILHGNLTTKIANVHNVTTAQIALKWIVQHEIPCVTKSANPDHLKEDLDLWTFNLTQQEMDELDAHAKPKGSPSFACSHR